MIYSLRGGSSKKFYVYVASLWSVRFLSTYGMQVPYVCFHLQHILNLPVTLIFSLTFADYRMLLEHEHFKGDATFFKEK